MPTWIWHAQEQGENLFARKKFHVQNRVHSAELRICADDGATIYLNGREILPAVTGRKAQRKDVTSRLRLGRNVLAAKVAKGRGERGFIAMLVVTLSTGKQLMINSDFSWKASPRNSTGWYRLDFNDSQWLAASMLAPHGAKPWGPVLNR
jgi:hypothetical protein